MKHQKNNVSCETQECELLFALYKIIDISVEYMVGWGFVFAKIKIMFHVKH